MVKQTIREFIRGDETIKSKVSIDFGGGFNRTIPEIEIIRKIIKEKDGKKEDRLNFPE